VDLQVDVIDGLAGDNLSGLPLILISHVTASLFLRVGQPDWSLRDPPLSAFG
jgi:hypothetical protein